MRTLILFSLLALVLSQFPCSNQSLDAVEVEAFTNSSDVDLIYGYNNVQGTWYNAR